MTRPIFSASQISAFEGCQRRWAYRYIDGLDAPQHPSAALGSEVHAQLEGWLRDGTPLDLTTKAGEIAMSGVHLLPQPKTEGMTVEDDFVIEITDFAFRGFIDVKITA